MNLGSCESILIHLSFPQNKMFNAQTNILRKWEIETKKKFPIISHTFYTWRFLFQYSCVHCMYKFWFKNFSFLIIIKWNMFFFFFCKIIFFRVVIFFFLKFPFSSLLFSSWGQNSIFLLRSFFLEFIFMLVICAKNYLWFSNHK